MNTERVLAVMHEWYTQIHIFKTVSCPGWWRFPFGKIYTPFTDFWLKTINPNNMCIVLLKPDFKQKAKIISTLVNNNKTVWDTWHFCMHWLCEILGQRSLLPHSSTSPSALWRAAKGVPSAHYQQSVSWQLLEHFTATWSLAQTRSVTIPIFRATIDWERVFFKK